MSAEGAVRTEKKTKADGCTIILHPTAGSEAAPGFAEGAIAFVSMKDTWEEQHEEVNTFERAMAFAVPFMKALDGTRLKKGDQCILRTSDFVKTSYGEESFQITHFHQGISSRSFWSAWYNPEEGPQRLYTHLTEEDWKEQFPGKMMLTAVTDFPLSARKWYLAKVICESGGIEWPWGDTPLF